MSGLSETNDTNYSLWKTTGRVKNLRVLVLLIRKEDGTWTRSKQYKANIYARYLVLIFRPNDIASELVMIQCPSLDKTSKKYVTLHL